MTSYFVGDIPATSLVVEPTQGGNYFDVQAFDNVDIYLYGPDGASVDTLDFASTITADGVSIDWPENSPFTMPGIYTLQLIMGTTAGRHETTDGIEIICEDRDGWHSMASARRDWTTGAPFDDSQLYTLLAIAKTQCLSYAPALVGRPPLNYRQAQLMQARNLLNAFKTDPAQSQDGELFVIRPYPMDNFVKQLLRPKQGVGVIG